MLNLCDLCEKAGVVDCNCRSLLPVPVAIRRIWRELQNTRRKLVLNKSKWFIVDLSVLPLQPGQKLKGMIKNLIEQKFKVCHVTNATHHRFYRKQDKMEREGGSRFKTF